MLGALLLNTALHVVEGAIHPLSKALLDLPVVIFNLHTLFITKKRIVIN